MSIFTYRAAFKPFEYPEVLDYQNAVSHSFWLFSEWNFVSDLHDFHVKLTDAERLTLKNALLAISQIEVSVKRFWTKLGDRFPKAEFEQIGVVYGESEVRHSLAYSHLLEILGFNDDFAVLLDNPVIKGRVEYLTRYLKGAADNSNEAYTHTLALFSLFVENVSLFSQFLVIKSFNKCRNVLKDVDNVVQATAKEELLHSLFGVYLVNKIKEEFPHWFNDEFHAKLARACRKAYQAEQAIIDWIFSAGDLPYLTAAQVKEFTKKRFNDSLSQIGAKPIFQVDAALLTPLAWFDEEVHADTNTDFFHKKSVQYGRAMISITADDLF